MIELFNSIDWDVYKSIDWDVYKEILMYGDPPVYVQLLVFIGLVIVFRVWRFFKGAHPMRGARKLKYMFLFFFIFFAILFQEKINLASKIDTIMDAFSF